MIIELGDAMWLVSMLAVVGVVLNIKKKRICFFVWLFTNSSWCLYDFYIGAYAQSALFLVYTVLAIWGIMEWRKK